MRGSCRILSLIVPFCGALFWKTTAACVSDRAASSQVDLRTYQEQVPGRIVVRGSGADWAGLELRTHALPAELKDSPEAPAIPKHTLTFVRTGGVEGERRSGGGAWEPFDPAPPGHVTLQPAGRTTDMRYTAPRPVRTLSLYLAPDALDEVALQMGMAPSQVEMPDRFGQRDPLLLRLATQLRYAAAGEGGSLYIESATRTLAVRLLRQHCIKSPEVKPEPGSLSPERTGRVLEYVWAHLGTDLTVADLADEVGLSPYHFTRRFRARMGMAPYEYILHERVQSARQRLRTTTQPLEQIAADLGFSSQSHLTRVFRAEVGVPPGAYRRAWQ